MAPPPLPVADDSRRSLTTRSCAASSAFRLARSLRGGGALVIRRWLRPRRRSLLRLPLAVVAAQVPQASLAAVLLFGACGSASAPSAAASAVAGAASLRRAAGRAAIKHRDGGVDFNRVAFLETDLR